MDEQFIQTQALVLGLAERALSAHAGRATAVPEGSLDLAVPAAALLLKEDARLEMMFVQGFKRLAELGQTTAKTGAAPFLLDAAGHKRDVYHPLVLHLYLSAFLKRYESLSVGAWGACEQALPDAVAGVRVIEEYADVAPPPGQVALVLWQTLCLYEQAQALSRDIDIELTDGVVHSALSQPGPGGSLHPQDGEQSLDAWTYREFCGVHALANLALQRRNTQWALRVEQVAMYHLENTQPDNATNQPWGLFAFAWSPRTRSLAEQQLHDIVAHGQGEIGLVAGLLLADAYGAMSTFGA